jgi:4a-hydroxytetrahydrobiopterin dehydratase
MKPTLLSPIELERALAELPGWIVRDGGFIVSQRELADFDEAMRFINDVADIARRLDHHPDLYNVYNRVRLELQTHDAGGITARDIEFARAVDALPVSSY